MASACTLMLICAFCRDELRQWLETAAATLPCNLPELMQHFRHSSPDGDGKGHRPVCRRDLLELLPLGIVHLVSHTDAMLSNCTILPFDRQALSGGVTV